MKFVFLGYAQEKFAAMTESEQEAMFEDCFGYDAKLLKDGHMLEDGAALQPGHTAKTLRWHDGAVIVSDGPYAETKEQLGGVGVMVADDMAQALDLMSKHPGLHYGATFEIRPINEEAVCKKDEATAKWRGVAPEPDPTAVKFANMGFINENGWGSRSKAEFDDMFAQCIAFDEERIKRGQWLSGVALQLSGTAKTLRARAGKVVVTDGPYAETKECLGGIVVLALQDMDEAVASLSKHPCLPYGVVMEIRPLDEAVSRRWEAMQGRLHTV